MNLRPWLALAAIIVLAPFGTKAEVSAGEEDGWVEIRTPDTSDTPYRDRRPRGAWQLGFGMENLKPDGYVSSIDGATYDDVFGEVMQALYIEAGYKLNMGPMSVSFLGGYGSSTIENTAVGETRDLKFERTSLKGMLIIDGVTAEPYVAPYVSFGVYRLGVDETHPDSGLSFSGQTQMGTITSFGLLIQLNWLEPEMSQSARFTSGLQNTYLDVFMTQQGKTSGSDDPDMSTAMNWGAGLRIEF